MMTSCTWIKKVTHLFILPKGNGKEDGGGGGGGCGGGGCGGGGGGGGGGGCGGGGCGGSGGSGRVNCHFVFTSLIFAENCISILGYPAWDATCGVHDNCTINKFSFISNNKQ